MSALGHKQTCAVQEPMSALPPKATSNATYAMSATGQKRTIRLLLDHLVGALLNMKRHVESERLGGLDIDNQLKLGRLFDR
jgi:hypothetical protein